MGKDERREISRIKIENLPGMCQAQGKVGPLGIVSKEPLPDDQGVRVSVDLSFVIPQVWAQIRW